ncbi:MAG TPA: DUF4097 family beta strand repeat-containing protein [Candidatus Paceibacterota bacterium]|nr:DUF4097 family beta strand repeat-containing protein [Verrucomicrobiota bacterium]HRY51589.1 DUF4097 family beta strand repeat-containing protein [Candidatus Paceibacterota bacterium]
MIRTAFFCLLTSVAALAVTEEKINKQFTVQSGGTLVVDIDFGAIEVSANTSGNNEVIVDISRKVSRKHKADEEAFLKERPITFSQDGNTLTIRSLRQSKKPWSWSGWSQNEAKYTIAVPPQFNTQLKTSGGGIGIQNLAGDSKAHTSGGGLRFTHLRGPLNGDTSGGGIHVTDCEGTIKIHTSGGGIQVEGGSGSIDGHTSGGSVTVKNFGGPARVDTSRGGITIEKVAGKVEGTTSGGSISAVLPSPLPGDVKLSTSGGGVTVRIPEDAAFQLDAHTSSGAATSELPVNAIEKTERNRLNGTVNGGGKTVFLRSSGGGIRIKRL